MRHDKDIWQVGCKYPFMHGRNLRTPSNGGFEMSMGNGSRGMICRGIEIEGPIGEQRLWIAVLLQAIEDLQSDRLRAKRAAEEFLLEDGDDFETVCGAAGINAGAFRARLSRTYIRKQPALLAA